MTYEVVYVDGFDDDLIKLNFSDDKILKLQARIENISKNNKPILYTERVKNTSLRKIPMGNHRVFLYINEDDKIIYGLSIKHHNCCYKKKEINKILTLLKKIKV